jgi:hypothetical protein
VFDYGASKRPPKNLATIDHLRSKLDPHRTEPARGERRRVLACYDCNHERAKKEYDALPVEEQRARGRRPRRTKVT